MSFGTSLLEKCAEENDVFGASASNQISCVYQMGDGVKIDFGKSLEWAKREIEIYETIYGVENSITADSYERIANLCDEWMQREEAVTYATKALEAKENIYGVNSDEYKACGLLYAGKMYLIKNYTYAISWYEYSLPFQISKYGEDSIEVAGTYNNIAMPLMEEGKQQEALEYLEKAKDILERKIGLESTTIANIYGNIGDVYKGLGKYDEAISNLEKNLAIREKNLRVGHPRLTSILLDIADTCREKGDVNKEIEFYIRMIENVESIGGRLGSTNYRYIGDICYDLYFSNLQKGINDNDSFEKAEKYLEKALEQSKKENPVGLSMFEMADLHYCLGTLYFNQLTQQGYELAVKYFKNSLGLYEQYQNQNGGQESKITLIQKLLADANGRLSKSQPNMNSEESNEKKQKFQFDYQKWNTKRDLRTAFRGYDKKEVEEFLNHLIEGYKIMEQGYTTFNIRPSDIRNKTFDNSFNGYDKAQSDKILQTIASDFENFLEKNKKLSEQNDVIIEQVNKNIEAMSIDELKRAAEAGNIFAQFKLSNKYLNGDGVEKSEELSLKWLKKSADKGVAPAKMMVGLRIMNGLGATKNIMEGIRWLEDSAKMGYAEAQYRMAEVYAKDEGVAQDYYKAAEWCLKSAEQGFVPAEMSIAWQYFYGQGVPQSKDKAIYWYQKAAEQGNEDAKRALREMG